MKKKFLLCEECGNLEELKEESPNSTCCNTLMKAVDANSTEASIEKHIPTIKVEDSTVTISVGEILHPMSEEHYISYIYLKTNKKLKKQALKPTDKPQAIFTLSENEEVIAAYSYCNLHGLWQKEYN